MGNVRLPLILLALTLAAAGQTPLRVLALQGETHHVQGIDTDGVHLWVTSVDRPTRKGFLYQFAVKDGRLIKAVETQDGDRYHPGGIATDATSIWIPVAEYRARSSSIVQRRDKRTLEVLSQFSVPDHIGCVAVTPEFIIGGNWDSKDFYVWDHKGTLIRKVSSETANSYQDLKFVSGMLVGSGLMAGRKSAIDWIEWPSLTLSRRRNLGNTDRGDPMSREGMTIFEGNLWLLPEDSASRLFVFPIDESR